MFQNKLRSQGSVEVDPFDHMNSNPNQELITQTDNPFGELFETPTIPDMSEINPEQHFVNPHVVDPYFRTDGTFVQGYWRDGDGNTDVDLNVNQGGGYMRTNPDDSLLNNFDTGFGNDDLL